MTGRNTAVQGWIEAISSDDDDFRELVDNGVESSTGVIVRQQSRMPRKWPPLMNRNSSPPQGLVKQRQEVRVGNLSHHHAGIRAERQGHLDFVPAPSGSLPYWKAENDNNGLGEKRLIEAQSQQDRYERLIGDKPLPRHEFKLPRKQAVDPTGQRQESFAGAPSHRHHSGVDIEERPETQVSENAPTPYKKRPRRKTHADKYDFKQGKKARDSKEQREIDRTKHSGRIRDHSYKDIELRRKGSRGSTLLHKYATDNVTTERLTLKPQHHLGQFSKGRSSTSQQQTALPDLSFPRNLEYSLHQQRPSQAGEGQRGKRQKVSKLQDAEVSHFFTSKRSRKSVHIGGKVQLTQQNPDIKSVVDDSFDQEPQFLGSEVLSQHRSVFGLRESRATPDEVTRNIRSSLSNSPISWSRSPVTPRTKFLRNEKDAVASGSRVLVYDDSSLQALLNRLSPVAPTSKGNANSGQLEGEPYSKIQVHRPDLAEDVDDPNVRPKPPSNRAQRMLELNDQSNVQDVSSRPLTRKQSAAEVDMQPLRSRIERSSTSRHGDLQRCPPEPRSLHQSNNVFDRGSRPEQHAQISTTQGTARQLPQRMPSRGIVTPKWLTTSSGTYMPVLHTACPSIYQQQMRSTLDTSITNYRPASSASRGLYSRSRSSLPSPLQTNPTSALSLDGLNPQQIAGFHESFAGTNSAMCGSLSTAIPQMFPSEGEDMRATSSVQMRRTPRFYKHHIPASNHIYMSPLWSQCNSLKPRSYQSPDPPSRKLDSDPYHDSTDAQLDRVIIGSSMRWPQSHRNEQESQDSNNIGAPLHHWQDQ